MVLAFIIVVGLICSFASVKSKNICGTIFSIIATIALGILSSYLTNIANPFLPYPSDSSSSITIANDDETTSIKSNLAEESDAVSSIDTVSDIQATPNPISLLKDITKQASISGSINDDVSENRYTFTAEVAGAYRFYTDLSSGGHVRIRISGQNDEIITSGIDALTTDLEANKTYIISIENQNGPCDYSLKIGIPAETSIITEGALIEGSITYQDQIDKYLYTAPINGIYRFDTELSAGGKVRVQVSGENGNFIDSGINGLTIDLEAGKTYLLSIEYYNGPCDYTVNTGVPIQISDISGSTFISGDITYQDQKDKYYYSASTSGTYRFDTNLSAGGKVRIQISGENGNYINSGIDGLTIDLEAGKTYILSIEYYNGTCNYTVNIGIPIEIRDISGSSSISGNITYQNQKDKYRYTASDNGTYHFDTNLSAGGTVCVQVSGENGNYINSGINGLNIDLEAGKTYILSIEYRNCFCSYDVLIVSP